MDFCEVVEQFLLQLAFSLVRTEILCTLSLILHIFEREMQNSSFSESSSGTLFIFKFIQLCTYTHAHTRTNSFVGAWHSTKSMGGGGGGGG